MKRRSIRREVVWREAPAQRRGPVAKPKTPKNRLLVPFLIALAVTTIAMSPHRANAGIFGAVQDAVTAPSGHIMTNSLALGGDIFAVIFASYVICGLCIATFKNDFDALWWGMAGVLAKMIPPLAALKIAQNDLPALTNIESFFAQRITGQPESALGPDALVTLGQTTALNLVHAASSPLTGPLGLIPTSVPEIAGAIAGGLIDPQNVPLALVNLAICWITAVIIYFSFVYVACAVVIAWAKFLWGSSIGAANVGFLGSEATQHMAFTWTGGVIASMWEVVFMVAWCFIVAAVFRGFKFDTALSDPKAMLTTTVSIAGFGLAVIVMTGKIEKMAERQYAGQTSFGMGDVTGTVTGAVNRGVSAALRVARLRA
jgi:hypothetical protein